MWSGATQGAWFESDALPGVLPHTLSAPPGALLMIAGKVGPAAKAALAELPFWTGCVVMISDKGQGRVRATADGRADLRYWFDPGDVERIKAGMKLTAEVLLAGGAREVFAPVFGTGRHRSAAALAEDLEGRTIQDFSLYASHPMASCRMGVDPARSVVGPDGQAHGLPGLYVADSSVFPTSLGVNPQLTTMALATALAQQWTSGGGAAAR
jgi:choline dehydrogenase-like flavoprotein